MGVEISPLPTSIKRHRVASKDLPSKRHRPLQETAGQLGTPANSDIFELQVDELLGNLESEANANIQKITVLLKQLKDVIEELPSQKPLRPKEAEAYLKANAHIVIPFAVAPPKDAQYTLEFKKPCAINVVGSAASNTLLSRNGQIEADLIVVMPTEMFQEKDYQRYRYFHKKAYYTACLVAGLQRAIFIGLSCTFSMQNGNPLQPCILARYQPENELPIVVRIICVAPKDAFSQDKILPWMNTPRHVSQEPTAAQLIPSSASFYNSTLRSEMLSLTYLSLIHNVSKETPALRKASLLFSIWLRQRGFGAELFQGGFGLFEAQALMAIMLHSDPVNGIQAMFRTRYDYHQLFKATLILLSKRDFVEDPMLYQFSPEDSTEHSISPSRQDAKKCTINGASAMFLDGTRAHNLFFKMSPWACNRLRRQAGITVKCLGGADRDRFDHCFISKLDNTMIRYDEVMHLDLTKLTTWTKLKDLTAEQTFDISNSLHVTLKQALTDRAQEISFGCERIGDWATTSDRPKPKKSLQLRIVVDARQASRLQDLGPSADQKSAAAAFRKFWGPKAELRRFRDGSIQETVAWNNNEDFEGIVPQIVRHALERHHGNEKAVSVEVTGASFWNQIHQPRQSRTLAPFEQLLKTYQNLEQIIRSLEMPLAIRQISPASSGLRYSLLNIDLDRSRQPLYIVVQFESSGQWPDDLGAVQQVKIAFLQKLADLLSQHDSSIRARVGLNQQSNKLFYRPFLEVMINALCFHIVLYHSPELVLLRSSPVESLEERKLVVPEIHYHNTMFLRAPAHTSRIRDLCTQYPLLSPAIRLFKAWCSGHLVIPHFREELLELFVVHVFTNSAPYGVPSSLRTAFLRTISMLAKWDWHNEPLFVKLSDEADRDLVGQLLTHFEAWRSIDPSFSRMAFIVGSTLDPKGTAWTENGPSKMIAARLISLAKAAYSTVMKFDLDLDPQLLFTHSIKDYDFVIHLNAKSIKAAGTESSIVFNSYLEELKQVFGENIVWFHSGESQKIIAGLWNPTVESRKWKVNLGYSTIPLYSGAQTTDGDVPEIMNNTKAILNEIVRLGGDLVSRVSLKDGHA